ncbi:shTK domain protein [Cooperia oncophora]
MRSSFEKGAKLWEQDTCINFTRNPFAKDRIMVFPEDGCWSYVGKLGGEQKLSLGSGCETVSIAAHEIGHALGFFHTMSRHDRDDFITVNKHNIKVDWLSQFNKETTKTNDNYNMTYDYGSIMHYGGTSASFNKKPTMVPFDIDYQQTLGSPFISFIELSMLNEHYGCKAICNKSTSVKCEMGGFPHPRDCQKMHMSWWLWWTSMEQEITKCSHKIYAARLTGRDSRYYWPCRGEQEDFEICHYRIKSPKGTEIEVKLVNFTKGLSIDGCPYAGVEIKTNKDQTLTGYRFCSPDAAGTILRSYINRVPIMTYNRIVKTTTVLEYRYVPANSPRATTATSTTTTTTTTTKRPVVPFINTGTGSKCEDNRSCMSLVPSGFCKGPLSEATKKKVCPKSCGFCDTLQ